MTAEMTVKLDYLGKKLFQMGLSFQRGLTTHLGSQLQVYFATLFQSHSIGPEMPLRKFLSSKKHLDWIEIDLIWPE